MHIEEECYLLLRLRHGQSWGWSHQIGVIVRLRVGVDESHPRLRAELPARVARLGLSVVAALASCHVGRGRRRYGDQPASMPPPPWR